MKYILTFAALVFATACSGQVENGFSLEVESFPVTNGSFSPYAVYTHKIYITARDSSDKLVAVFGNNEMPLVITAPEGIFNSVYANSWNGANSYFTCEWNFFGCDAELVIDSYATIGLDNSPYFPVPGGMHPSLVQDPSLNPGVAQFFSNYSMQLTELNVNTLTGASWSVSPTATNASPDANGRWLIMQLTSTGPISGMLNVHLFPMGVSEDQVTKTFEFGVFSCSDESACNYDPTSSDDLFCDYSCCPGPGCCGTGTFWDESSQTCLAYPVPPSNTNPSDVNMDGCVGIDDFLVHLSNFGSGCGAPQWACGDDVTFLGDEYATVQIGGQCWFQENLRYLPSIHPGEHSSTNPRYYVYGYDGLDLDLAKQTESYQNHGVLYNWPAAMQAGICPVGWHLPTEEEFLELLESSNVDVNEEGAFVFAQDLISGSFQGGLPGRVDSIGVEVEGSQGSEMWLWTQEESLEANTAVCLGVQFGGVIGNIGGEQVSTGQSIRCIQDSE